MNTSHFSFSVLICMAILQFCTCTTGQNNIEDDVAASLNQIQNQLNSHQTKINQLERKIQELETENGKLKTEIYLVKNENKRLNSENQKFKAEIDLKITSQKVNTKISGQYSSGASFVARATTQRTYSAGQAVLFDDALENVGSHYDPTNGQYTCPTNGYYLFSSTIMAVPDYSMRSAIYVDDSAIVFMLPAQDWDQTSVTAVVSCAAGQVVTVRSTYDDQYARGVECSFTGTLLSLNA